MMATNNRKNPWYVAGLHFQCSECGECCSGPGEGYIWVTKPEIKLIADFLKQPIGQLRRDYLEHVGLRTTVIEQPENNDCIFLRKIDGRKECVIYPVRPNQCRTWPFWSSNLVSSAAWNRAVEKCPGINRGKLYSFKEIRKIKSSKKWWADAER